MKIKKIATLQIGKIVPVTLDNARLYPLTVLGASVPQFHLVETLEAGMLIENTPNLNFSSIFDSLEEVSGPVVIVGNAQLTSLDGKDPSSVYRTRIASPTFMT